MIVGTTWAAYAHPAQARQPGREAALDPTSFRLTLVSITAKAKAHAALSSHQQTAGLLELEVNTSA